MKTQTHIIQVQTTKIMETHFQSYVLMVLLSAALTGPFAALAQTPPGNAAASAGWDVETVEAGNDLGKYIALAFGPSGNPALAYNYDTSGQPFRQLKFAQFNGISWNIETVMDGGGGASLAFNAAGAPAISHVASSKLYFVVKSGATWNSTIIEKNNVLGDVTSLANDRAGKPAISYYKPGRSGGLVRPRTRRTNYSKWKWIP